MAGKVARVRSKGASGGRPGVHVVSAPPPLRAPLVPARRRALAQFVSPGDHLPPVTPTPPETLIQQR